MLDEAVVGDQAGLAERLAQVRERIAEAARRAGRDPAAITLVAVSKTCSAQIVAALAAAGQRDFGENRIEEAGPKMAGLATDGRLRWHMIGHVQGRKAADAVRAGFELVHSVDSLRLGERLSRSAQAAARRQPVLLECNVSGELSKSGFPASQPLEWPALIVEMAKLTDLPGLDVRGLMTMAPQVARPELARPYFDRLAALRDYLRGELPGQTWTELSMGMSDDFEAAIEAGATIVRVGRAIFGVRH